VERLDDLGGENGRGQKAFPAVDHQVKVDVAAISA
jgi:hypothetical protein